jgi:hypothetical protein
MIREKITYKEFHKIAKEHEHFLWHFVQKEQHKNNITVSSILDEGKEKNPLEYILKDLDIPYYESYTEDSMDFLMGLGYSHKNLYYPRRRVDENLSPNFRFGPVLIGFKKFTNVLSTKDRCYCLEGIIEVIQELNPDYIEKILLNLEKYPD